MYVCHCIICGHDFESQRFNANVCSKECRLEKLRRLQAALRANRPRRVFRGVSPERAIEIERLEEFGTIDEIADHAKTWSHAEHMFARRCYERVHGLFHIYNFN